MPLTLTPALPNAFHRYFAGWTRIEPRCRSDHATAGLEARTADPLWLLGREWQFGEFRAEDAGSPVSVEVAYRTARLRQLVVRRPDGSLAPRADLTMPLETLVEREPVHWERDWRQRVRVGQQFERFCRDNLGGAATDVIAAYRATLGIEAVKANELVDTDRATRRYRHLMANKVVDGWRVWSAPTETLPPGAEAAVEALKAWWESLYSEPADGVDVWQPDRLDYRLTAAAPLGAGAEVLLSAPSYRNGDFDWHSCRDDSLPVNWDTAPAVPGTEQATQKYAPTRVTFGGMPLPRYWAFEDARVDFGGLDVGTTDVAKLALAEFALSYGDDWFIVPLELPLGSCTRISRLTVQNVFGESVNVPPARTVGAAGWARWQMYVLNRSGPQGGFADYLFVPPAIGFREESEPVEEVRFLRDEGANMVWGVEHLVRNGLGAPVDGFDAQLEQRALQRETSGAAARAACRP